VGRPVDEWKSVERVRSYLARVDRLSHRAEGERLLLELLPTGIERVIDLGAGDGKLLALVRTDYPRSEGVALDFSDPMLEAARRRFSNDARVSVIKHDLSRPLPTHLGRFDLVVSSVAIHHLTHPQKRRLYKEVFHILTPGGIFCNLEHVASPTRALHERFLKEIGLTRATEDRSNKLLDVETQLSWLRQLGFRDVDCYWKWLELALLVGVKPKK
jgi:tRNA (cmo5U34)-methyltransferase